jgi:hypothetical protein
MKPTSILQIGKSAALLLTLALPGPVNADYPSEVLSDGPKAYLRFSETVPNPSISILNNSAASGLANAGSYRGLETGMKQQPGALAGDAAARFDGSSQYALVPTGSPVNLLAPPFSVEAWVRPDTARASGSLVCPLGSLYRSGNNAKGWLFYQDADGWNYRHGSSTGYKVNLKTGGVPVVGQWYHLVATFSGTETKLYVNGVPGAPNTTATEYEANAEVPFGIGARGDAGFRFPGSVDEVAVYPAVLSADDIASHYTAATSNPAGYPALVQALNPVAYYRLNEPVYLFPKAANSGTLGAAADGSYRAHATTAAGPQPPTFPGFEANNSAAVFDGVDGMVRVPDAGNLTASELRSVTEATIIAWVNPTGPQANYKGIFAKRPLSDGLYLKENDTLNYSWNDAGNTWGFDSGLTPPSGEWSLAAVVIRPTETTFYLQSPSGGFSTAVNVVSHNPADFTAGPWAVANDINFGGTTRYFNGAIDEAAMFNKALSEGRIRTYFLTATGSTDAPGLVSRTPILTPADVIYSTTTFTIDIDAYGAGMTYQWRKDGTPIPGATQRTFVKNNAASADAGSYDVVVSNAGGSVTSDAVVVTINPAAPPTVTQQPVSTTRYAGATATFSVVAGGTPPFTYQWTFKGLDLVNETSATLAIPNASQDNAGAYAVKIRNVAGFIQSASATLSIITPKPGSYEETVVSMKPVAYWRLNEQNGTAVAADNVGGHDASVNVTVVGAVDGPRPPTFPGLESGNTAMLLNGADTEISSGASLVNNRAAFSILGWFKPTGPQPAGSGRVGLFGQNDVTEFGYHGLGTVGIWTPNGGFASTASSIIRENEWNFITATADGRNLTLYMNGRQVAQAASTTANYGSSASPFNIGYAVLDTAGNYFLGAVDEVAFFDRALTPAEVLAIANKATGLEFKISITAGHDVVKDVKPSGTLHDGYSNGATWVASDTDADNVKRDGVFQFNSASWTQVVIPHSLDFNAAEGTMTLWMRSKGNSDPGGNDASMLVDRRTSIGDVLVLEDAGTLFWQPNWNYGQSSTSAVNDDKWHHIAYVYDQILTVNLYIDGVLDATHDNTTVWNWPVNPVELGRSHDPYWRAYDGFLDDFRIYNRKLTEEEIMSIKSGDTASIVAPENLAGRWSFDEPPGGLRMTLTWPMGVLQSADKVEGPYADVPGAASPYSTVSPSGNRYFRLRL